MNYLARLRVALRHQASLAGDGPVPVFTVGDVPRGPGTAAGLNQRNEEIHLTPHEYKLLTTLIQHAGKVVTHSQLLAKCGDPAITTKTTICVFTWGNCATNWKKAPPNPAICSPNPVSAINS